MCRKATRKHFSKTVILNRETIMELIDTITVSEPYMVSEKHQNIR